ncbi:HIT family protein [Macrococcus epidermidis]|uniref:HIT family protein n=1 Tax=Macrococcus epidermidis TaxID=1902580 RepID=UPI001EF25E74|nr:HIT family protein [Macrococcus epidermidis]MCG7421015.1 HIT family protein [Macrococcus epidermidis]
MCIFCNGLEKNQIIYETKHFKVVFDINPEQEGHMLLISKDHYMNYLELPDEVVLDLIQLERKLIQILEGDMNIYGVSLIKNNGQVMDEGTHFHEHIIPRYEFDGFWDEDPTRTYPFDFQRFIRLINS